MDLRDGEDRELNGIGEISDSLSLCGFCTRSAVFPSQTLVGFFFFFFKSKKKLIFSWFFWVGKVNFFPLVGEAGLYGFMFCMGRVRFGYG